MQFGFVALNVGIMLLSAVPGFVFAKTKFMKGNLKTNLRKVFSDEKIDKKILQP